MNSREAKALYANRKLGEGYPDLESIGVESFIRTQSRATNAPATVGNIVREIGLPTGNNSIVIVGSGPHPVSVRALRDLGYDARGVEPVADYVATANAWLGDDTLVRRGKAEALPFDDETQAIVLIESVLEHVDSPVLAISEAYRVLVPGGVAYVQTTNRRRFSITGENGEYSVPFLNWMPGSVKEAFAHHHLHFNPKLANFTPRPAVHWFSYSDLCRIGRDAGFHRFYCKFDLVAPDDPSLTRGRLRARFLDLCRYNPWVRSIALTQFGDTVYMLKRTD